MTYESLPEKTKEQILEEVVIFAETEHIRPNDFTLADFMEAWVNRNNRPISKYTARKKLNEQIALGLLEVIESTDENGKLYYYRQIDPLSCESEEEEL